MAVDKFEDLIAWQKARALTKAIYEATRKDHFAKDFGLTGQVQRAAVSIMSNVAEGFERNRPAEFHRFLFIAKASCAELRFPTLHSIGHRLFKPIGICSAFASIARSWENCQWVGNIG